MTAITVFDYATLGVMGVTIIVLANSKMKEMI